MTKGSSSGQCDSAVAALLAGQEYVQEHDLTSFRDIYNRLKGEVGPVAWILIFAGEQVFAFRPAGKRQVIIVGQKPSRSDRYFSRADFSFMDPSLTEFMGSADGRYTLFQFLREVVTMRRGTHFLAAVLIFAVVTYLWVPVESTAVLLSTTSASLAIFVSIFALFVVSVNPRDEYPYIRDGRFRKLVQADLFIASIGLCGLLTTTVGAAIAAHPDVKTSSLLAVFLSISTGVSISLAILSFWLVLAYHFRRKHEMTEYQMVQHTIDRLEANRHETPDA